MPGLFTIIISILFIGINEPAHFLNNAPNIDVDYRDTGIIPGVYKDVVKIAHTWELPSALKEISGMDFIDSERLACIQDEAGSIFIFNLHTGNIEKEIPFGPPGDYEAIAIVKEDAYVACADGRIFEIAGYLTNPEVKEYGTHLTVKQNPGGLCYDAKDKRLLVAIKGRENENQLYKGIYAFDLLTKKMQVKPVFRIDLLNPVFGGQRQKKALYSIQPSEIAIHPITNDMYITDAVHSQIMIMDAFGTISSLHLIDRQKFIQPEGITFSPQGSAYIACKGNKHQPGRLMLVDIK